MESRRDHPKQATSDYKTLDRVQLSRDARPSSKTSKHVSTSVSKVTSSSSRPSQQSQARQSLNLQKEMPKPNPRLKSSVSSKPSVQKNTSGKSREAPVQDRVKRPEPSRIPSKLPPNKVTSGSAQQNSVERRFIEFRKEANRNSTAAANGSERNRLNNQHRPPAPGRTQGVTKKGTNTTPSSKPRPSSATDLRQHPEYPRQVCVVVVSRHCISVIRWMQESLLHIWQLFDLFLMSWCNTNSKWDSICDGRRSLRISVSLTLDHCATDCASKAKQGPHESNPNHHE